MEYRIQNTEYRPNWCLSVKRSASVAVCLLSVLTVLLSGCRPRGILHSGEMRRILADLHKTDGLVQTLNLQYGHDEALNIYYAQVLEKHGVTQAQFDSSLVWYTAHPVLFDKIYPKVQADLQAEHEAFKQEFAAELHLTPQKREEYGARSLHDITPQQMDSILWVTQHGYPNTWNPLVHNLKNQFFPQIGVLR